MKHPVLFDVPKTHPSRQQLLDAFKAKHEIETNYCRFVELPWMALHIPSAKKLAPWIPSDAGICGFIAEYGMRLDDSGLVHEAKTEREAVQAACDKAGILFNP